MIAFGQTNDLRWLVNPSAGPGKVCVAWRPARGLASGRFESETVYRSPLLPSPPSAIEIVRPRCQELPDLLVAPFALFGPVIVWPLDWAYEVYERESVRCTVDWRGITPEHKTARTRVAEFLRGRHPQDVPMGERPTLEGLVAESEKARLPAWELLQVQEWVHPERGVAAKNIAWAELDIEFGKITGD